MWAFVKRIFLFSIVNILILLTVSITFNIVMSLFGVQLGDQSGILAFYAMLGMGGAFISLALSRIMAKMMLGVRVIDPKTQDVLERQLVDIIYDLARKAHLPKMPEV